MATILIVDDKPAERKFLATFLERAGHRLLEARALARAEGVSHIISNPAQSEELLRTVRAALDFPTVFSPTAAAEEEFDRAHLQLLTDKLSEKIAELEAANKALRSENKERRHAEQALRESEER